MNKAVGWIATRSSSDYFNSCALFGSVASVPLNLFGYQYAASGNAYAGFWAKEGTSVYKEHLGTPLISNLQIGTRYFVSIKVNLSPRNGNETNYCGINKIGVLFSTINYGDFYPSPVNNYAQIYSDSIITDTLNWVTIRGNFVADSNYSFITIGSFFTDSLTDSLQLSGSICRAYYFVDDVCVSTDSVYAYNYTGIIENTFQPFVLVYPNPASDFIKVDCSLFHEVYNIYIYDDSGREVFLRENVINLVEHIPITSINSNILFVRITYKNGTFNSKILKIKP